MTKIIINIVKWREDGAKLFKHTGKTFQLEKEDLGLVKEHRDEVKIDSEFPIVITERTYTTADGKSIRNLSIEHELIGLISDYYLFNDPSAQPIKPNKKE